MSSARVSAFLWIGALLLAQNALAFLVPAAPVPLATIALVRFALVEGSAFGLALGAFAGAYHEVFASGPFGTEIVASAAVGAAAGLLSSKIFPDNPFTQAVLAAAAVFVRGAAAAALSGSGALWTAAPLAAALWAAAAAPFLFGLLGSGAARRRRRW